MDVSVAEAKVTPPDLEAGDQSPLLAQTFSAMLPAAHAHPITFRVERNATKLSSSAQSSPCLRRPGS